MGEKHNAHGYHPSHDRLPRYTFSCLGPTVVLLFAFYAIYCFFGTSPPNPAERYMKKPMDAMEYYLKTVDDYLSGGRGVYAKDVMFCVTAEDRAWFNRQYRSIAGSRADLDIPQVKEKNLTGGELALYKLLSAGPRDRNAEIAFKSTAATLATCIVTEKRTSGDDTGARVTYEKEFVVDLKKEDGLWRVVHFAGVRGQFD